MKGDIYIGRAEDNSRVFLKLKDLQKSVFIAGIIGSGKTALLYLIVIQLIKQGIKVWWIDTIKKDGQYLASMIPNMIYNRLNDNYFYSPIQQIQGREDEEIYNSFVEQFCRCNHLLEGSQAYLTGQLHRTLNRFRTDGISRRITIPDILETLHADRSKFRRVNDYQAATENRLEFLLNSAGRTVNCCHGFSIDKQADISSVLDMTGHPPEVQTFFISTLIDSLIKTRMARGEVTSELKNVIIFDEANRLFPKNQEQNYVEPMPTLSYISQISREYGVGLCGATQTPSYVATTGLKSQSFIKILIGSLGSNEDYYDMGNVMGMDEDQIDWLKKNGEVGRAVVKLAGGVFTEPFLVKIPFLNLKDLDP